LAVLRTARPNRALIALKFTLTDYHALSARPLTADYRPPPSIFN